jgi:hypothetical protein
MAKRRARSTPRVTKKTNYPSVWQGPETHGITHSLLNSWKESPEICSTAYIDGKRPRTVDMKIEYGNLHHLFDETYGNSIAGLGGFRKSSSKTALKNAQVAIDRYVAARSAGLVKNLKLDLAIAAMQVSAIYPHYLHHYRHHEIQWIARESVFRVPLEVTYPFDSAATPPRLVYLTGKRDGLYKAKDGNVTGIGLWEIKTKTRIDRAHLADQLRCDSQSLYYLFATLLEAKTNGDKLKPVQETYDVLKRPAFVRGNNESVEAYVKRCSDRVAEKPNEFFARTVISLREPELQTYANHFLIPEIRAFLEWWDSVKEDPSPAGRAKSRLHYLSLAALINAWGRSPYYEALVENPSSRTLRSIAVPFPELYDDMERAKIEAAEDATAVTALPSQKDRAAANKELRKKATAALKTFGKKPRKKS